MTTSEIEDARYLVPTDQDKLHNVITVLKRADLAKFARFQPDLNQSQKDLKMIKDFLKSTRLSWTTIKNGVKILCYDCKLSNEEIKLNNQINYEY